MTRSRVFVVAAAACAVVATDAWVLTARYPGALPAWAAALPLAVALAAVLWLSWRRALTAFPAAVALFAVAPGAYLTLLWTAYRAGRSMTSRAAVAVTAAVACGGLAAHLLPRADGAGAVAPRVTSYLVFVALPLLLGRYVAQHERLVAALEGLAERERLRERLRIARDVHDALGQRLGLVSVQAAALEVAEDLPPERRAEVRRLARSARAAMAEAYELIGALRGDPDAAEAAPIDVDELVAEFRAAGTPVAFEQRGEPLPLPDPARQAAYRVVQEGLTNAAKHAPGRPVTVGVTWEDDAALVSVVSAAPRAGGTGGAGLGLVGLRERVELAGGLLDHGPTDDGGFRLLAMLPATTTRRPRATAPRGAFSLGVSPLGVAVAVALLLVPGAFLVGIG